MSSMYQDPYQSKVGEIEDVKVIMPSLITQPVRHNIPVTRKPSMSLVDMIVAKKQQEATQAAKQAQEQPKTIDENKTYEQKMAESGQQSVLDQAGSQPKPSIQQQVQPQIQQEKIGVNIPSMQAQSTQTIPDTQPKLQSQQAQVAVNNQIQPTQAAPVIQPQPQPKITPVTQEGSDLTKQVNQQFGNPNAGLYGYDAQGNPNINRGVDIAAEAGEIQSAPKEGEWKVKEATTNGGWNTGWGNSVVIENQETGETIRRSHLNQVLVEPGEEVTGKPVGTTGRTGNTTGFHKDIEYTNSQGQLDNYLNTTYAGEKPGISSQPKPQLKLQQKVKKVDEIQKVINTALKPIKEKPIEEQTLSGDNDFIEAELSNINIPIESYF